MRAPRAVAVTLLLSGAASAELLSPERAALVGRLLVFDARGVSRDVRALTLDSPTLLLPVFTRCSGTCPFTAIRLKEAVAKAHSAFRVVLLSFDSEDTAQDLREFREHFALPPAWALVRSPDPAATRAFFDELGFHFMKTSDGFDHPNVTFVLSPRARWAATLEGTAFARQDLDTAWRRALRADNPTRLEEFRAWLVRPASWIALAGFGLVLSLIVVAMVVRAARPA